jgi:hypothetical protein
MLKSLRLSQIDFKSLLKETQGTPCLQNSAVLKQQIETIVQKAVALKLPSRTQVAPSAGQIEQSRHYAKDESDCGVSCFDIVSLLIDPFQPTQREGTVSEKEAEQKLAVLEDYCGDCVTKENRTVLKLAAMELQLDEARSNAASIEHAMQLRLASISQALVGEVLLRAGLRARCRLQARELTRLREGRAELEKCVERSCKQSTWDCQDQEVDHMCEDKFARAGQKKQLGPRFPSMAKELNLLRDMSAEVGAKIEDEDDTEGNAEKYASERGCKEEKEAQSPVCSCMGDAKFEHHLFGCFHLNVDASSPF